MMQQYLDAAVKAAQLAGEILMTKQRAMLSGSDIGVREKDSPLDLVTDADGAAQKAVTDLLHARFPEHRFLCEEDMEALGNPASPFVWVVDPLDGTTCFIHGKDNFGTLIALKENGVTVVGVMSMPRKGLLFTCIRGQGAYCNGKPVLLRKTRNLNDAILCSNTMHRAHKGSDGIYRIPTPPCGSLQNYGSAVEEFAEILLGHNDGAYFDGIKPWDIAPGCLMVEEAGGKSASEALHPEDPRSGLLAVASTAPIFEELSHQIMTLRITQE